LILPALIAYDVQTELLKLIYVLDDCSAVRGDPPRREIGKDIRYGCGMSLVRLFFEESPNI
jgi:hypothetical protein